METTEAAALPAATDVAACKAEFVGELGTNADAAGQAAARTRAGAPKPRRTSRVLRTAQSALQALFSVLFAKPSWAAASSCG